MLMLIAQAFFFIFDEVFHLLILTLGDIVLSGNSSQFTGMTGMFFKEFPPDFDLRLGPCCSTPLSVSFSTAPMR